MKIKRNYQQIIGFIIYPVLMISIIMIVIIIIPISLVDKISNLITLLIVITVYQLMLLDNLPTSKEHPIAGQIVQGVFKTAAFLIFVGLIVLIFHQDSMKDK